MKLICNGLLLAVLLTGCTSTSNTTPVLTTPPPASFASTPAPKAEVTGKVTGRTLHATLPSGTILYDFYTPATNRPVPLVIVAHGFQRTRAHMTLWGKKLAEEGFVAAVPDLPGWADHSLNAQVINELAASLLASPPDGTKIEPARMGYIGLSAGGLATLMAAVKNPAVIIWVGLDPVEFAGQGAAVAPSFKGEALVLRADPSPWNAYGNAIAIEEKLPPGWHKEMIPHAIHIDPEWPTDLTGQLLIGQQSDERRNQFVRLTVDALKKKLLPPKAVAAE